MFLFYIIKYKLEYNRYFPTIDLIYNLSELKTFWLEKWDTLILRVGFESHEARAMRRTRSMTDAA
jgi:hypothetical protein